VVQRDFKFATRKERTTQAAVMSSGIWLQGRCPGIVLHSLMDIATLLGQLALNTGQNGITGRQSGCMSANRGSFVVLGRVHQCEGQASQHYGPVLGAWWQLAYGIREIRDRTAHIADDEASPA
jgi:hypothetical protein